MSQKSFNTTVSNNTSFGNPVFAKTSGSGGTGATGEVSDGVFKPRLAGKLLGCTNYPCNFQGGGQGGQVIYCRIQRGYVGVVTDNGNSSAIDYYRPKTEGYLVRFGASNYRADPDHSAECENCIMNIWYGNRDSANISTYKNNDLGDIPPNTSYLLSSSFHDDYGRNCKTGLGGSIIVDRTNIVIQTPSGETIETPTAAVFFGDPNNQMCLDHFSKVMKNDPELKSGTAETLRILREHSNQDF